MITLQRLQAICRTPKGRSEVEKYADHLRRHMLAYGIDTPLREAAFLAQIAHESQDFTRVMENLNYSADGLMATWPNRFRGVDGKPNEIARRLHRDPVAIANHVYANRMGNGGPESGDGWRYRGMGLKMLTGKENYAACGRGLGVNLVGYPEMLTQPEYAVRAACWFWDFKDLNPLADAGQFIAVTRRINGGTIGLEDRQHYYVVAKKVLEC